MTSVKQSAYNSAVKEIRVRIVRTYTRARVEKHINLNRNRRIADLSYCTNKKETRCKISALERHIVSARAHAFNARAAFRDHRKVVIYDFVPNTPREQRTICILTYLRKFFPELVISSFWSARGFFSHLSIINFL